MTDQRWSVTDQQQSVTDKEPSEADYCQFERNGVPEWDSLQPRFHGWTQMFRGDEAGRAVRCPPLLHAKTARTE